MGCSNNIKQKTTDTPTVRSLPHSSKISDSSLVKYYKTEAGRSAISINTNNDTLSIVTTGWFFYYPFGKFHDLKSLNKIGKNISVKKELEKTSDAEPVIIYRSCSNDSFVKFIDQPETNRFEIVSGDIKSDDITLLNGVKVGMDRPEFIDLYFKSDAQSQLADIKTFKFITALDGMWHYYTFKNGKLLHIQFDTDYQLDKR